MKILVCALALFCNGLNGEEVESADQLVKLERAPVAKKAMDKILPCSSKTEVFFSKGDDPLDQKGVAAYSFPASFCVKNPYHVFSTVSYLYWLADQEGMDIATTAAVSTLSGLVQPSQKGTTTLIQPMQFTSGFKVGLGGIFNFDQWVLKAEYTYLHPSTTQSSIAPDPENGIPVFYMTSWFDQVSSIALQGLAATDLHSKWQLSLNWMDLVLQRPFYSGRSLILTPFVGLRGSWMNQTLNIRATHCVNVSPENDRANSWNHSDSWGLGPRGGMEGIWLLGAGWKFLGDVGMSLLFTQYTNVEHSESLFPPGGGDPLKFSIENYNCIRPIFEAKMGFGWGTYYLDDRYHVDLSATYDWNYLMSENMIRLANDQWIFGIGAAANALSVQGLSITARFDF